MLGPIISNEAADRHFDSLVPDEALTGCRCVAVWVMSKLIMVSALIKLDERSTILTHY